MNPTYAPDFPESLDWVNCEPISLTQQRGRVVALVFWSASSAYCHNLLLDLQAIAARHSDGLTVIAVHTPKFEAERYQRIPLKTINRIGFRMPVAHDPKFMLWQHYEANAWPTVVLIDAQGQVASIHAGDDALDEIDSGIHELLDQVGAHGRVFESHPPSVRPEARLPLAFPSGLAVGLHHLYIVDTGHHRVLECSHEGRILRQFGTGTPGFVDGNAAECCFHSPRGIHLGRDALYVADTGNHAVRRIALLNGDTDTIAGTGHRGFASSIIADRPTQSGLDSPWAITGNSDRLYIAMASGQQIWELDQGKRTMSVLAGSGQLGLGDGAGDRAALAQPAALALVQQTLYVADSAGSAIRGVHTQGGQIHTLIGHGLFEFGDQDGARHTALLQYPLALAVDAKTPQLWIADSYNNQLKVLRLGGGEVRRFEITYQLHEPAAIATSPNLVWIANTNSHEVLRVEIDNAQVRRLPIGE